ncbi:MAG TPA: hypothetical protein VFX98_07710 [Longimicrobiaceae bacterium]|nr:hypothetical protein [Longimicrobiaceae bacterium]
MIQPDLRVPPAGQPVRCILDRHLGPFEPIEELAGWLGTDWFNCRVCHSTVTAATAASQRCAA